MDSLFSRCLFTDVKNIDEILAFPSMQREENRKKLYLIDANGTVRYLEYNEDEEQFLKNLNQLYNMSVSCYIPNEPADEMFQTAFQVRPLTERLEIRDCDIENLFEGFDEKEESEDEMYQTAYEPRNPFPEYSALTPLDNLFSFMENGGIKNVEYLFTRGWFCRSPELHEKIFKLVMKGRGHLLDVTNGDFDEHLDSLLI
jgi:hypothetical protein